jgi:hypothetical protein
METTGSRETLVTIKWSNWCYIPEDYNLNIDHRHKLGRQIRSLWGSETFVLCFSWSVMDVTRLIIHGSKPSPTEGKACGTQNETLGEQCTENEALTQNLIFKSLFKLMLGKHSI